MFLDSKKQHVLLPGVRIHYIIALARKQNVFLPTLHKHYLIALIRKQNLMSSMAWVRRCYSEKSKNLNKLLVFEAL